MFHEVNGVLISALRYSARDRRCLERGSPKEINAFPESIQDDALLSLENSLLRL